VAGFFMRGRIGGMNASERNALSRKLSVLDQRIAENEELIFALDDDAWTQAEKSLETLRELRRQVEWELMAE
jgi:hypothetical protein